MDTPACAHRSHRKNAFAIAAGSGCHHFLACSGGSPIRMPPHHQGTAGFEKITPYHFGYPRHHLGALNGLQDSRVRSAAAQMSLHRVANLGIRRLRGFRQRFGSLDDHAVIAVAARYGLFVDHGLLNRMQRRAWASFFCAAYHAGSPSSFSPICLAQRDWGCPRPRPNLGPEEAVRWRARTTRVCRERRRHPMIVHLP